MQNRLKLVRNLLEKKKLRDQEQLFVVEGLHLIEEAINLVGLVVFCRDYPLLAQLKAKGIECLKITQKEFKELSQVETPQGILAVVKIRDFSLDNLTAVKQPLIVFCHEIQDPGNLGTIIRTADAAGASGVILSQGTVDLYNPKVIRSTMGSIFHLPIVKVENSLAALKKLKDQGIKIVAADLKARADLYSVDFKKPCAIVLGNEGSGLPENISTLCDQTIKIPLRGQAESLNVAISAAVILYEALRQRLSSC